MLFLMFDAQSDGGMNTGTSQCTIVDAGFLFFNVSPVTNQSKMFRTVLVVQR